MRRTLESFIEKASLLHNNKYNYEDTGYIKTATMINIVCPLHGAFKIRASNHLAGVGCKQCGTLKCSSQLVKSKEHFLKLCFTRHGTYYDYSLVDFQRVNETIDIICPKHGLFKQKACAHSSGKGCAECAKEGAKGTTSSFIEKALKVHPHKNYDYSFVDYTLTRVPVRIICQDHGEFLQKPHAHLGGNGCPKCAGTGFKDSLPGTFYVLFCGEITKCGITNRATSKRISQLAKGGKHFEVMAEFKFSEGSSARKLESTFLKYLRSMYKSPNEVFDGYTECFLNVNHVDLFNRISLEINNI